MLYGGIGLKKLSTERLERVLKAVYKESLPCPISAKGLAEAGFLGLKDDLDFLQGLDKAAVQAVLVAVLAERRP